MIRFLMLVMMLVASFAVTAQTTSATRGASVVRAESSEKRVALVVGNGRYAHLGKLENSVNDAADIARVLKKIGFEVIHVQDSNRQGFFSAMKQFRQSIQQGGVSLFYYAGHGIQSNGVNYLMPIDAGADDEVTVRNSGVPLDEVLGLMSEARSGLKIVYLDACRNDPPQLKRSTRSSARGLTEVPKAQGTIIEFSTNPGNVALDGKAGDRNSPYTAALLKYIERPGLQIEQLGKLVRAEVMGATNGKQEPWTSSSITNDFFFVAPKDGQQQIIVASVPRAPEPALAARSASSDSSSDLPDSVKQTLDDMARKTLERKFPQATRPVSKVDLDKSQVMEQRFRGLFQDAIASAPQSERFAVRDKLNERLTQFNKHIRYARLDEAEKILVASEQEYKDKR